MALALGTMAMAMERRATPRVELKVEVDFSDHHNFYTGFTQDISEGGLFVATYSLREIGTEIDLTFELPNGREIQVLGQVRWLRDPNDVDDDTPPGMGIQFVGLSPEDASAIHEYVEHRPTMFYDE
jgi:uncharacterized protein (TIGR02266 family)